MHAVSDPFRLLEDSDAPAFQDAGHFFRSLLVHIVDPDVIDEELSMMSISEPSRPWSPILPTLLL